MWKKITNLDLTSSKNGGVHADLVILRSQDKLIRTIAFEENYKISKMLNTHLDGLFITAPVFLDILRSLLATIK